MAARVSPEPAGKAPDGSGAKPSRAQAQKAGKSAALRRDLTPADLDVFEELEALVRYIETAKREIAALCPEEIREKHIREATDELDAIVAHTEDATGAILDAAEKIEKIAASLEGDPATRLAGEVTRIYEACNFQDITGQRIGKVVAALKTIESRIESLAAAWGGAGAGAGPAAAGPASKSDADLLRGPQLAGNAKTQEEIDALLKSFD